MVEEAETNAAADKEKSAQIETKNQADSVAYQTKKQLEELESKIDVSEKEKVESLLNKLQTAIENDDTDSMKSLSEEIKQVMMEIGQKVYSQTNPTSTNDSDGETIETDFSVGK
jgi:molecular chaperone DnaK